MNLHPGSQLPGQSVGSKCVYQRLGMWVAVMVQVAVISEGQHYREGPEPSSTTQPVGDSGQPLNLLAAVLITWEEKEVLSEAQ